jgi:hypothetical protein
MALISGESEPNCTRCQVASDAPARQRRPRSSGRAVLVVPVLRPLAAPVDNLDPRGHQDRGSPAAFVHAVAAADLPDDVQLRPRVGLA